MRGTNKFLNCISDVSDKSNITFNVIQSLVVSAIVICYWLEMARIAFKFNYTRKDRFAQHFTQEKREQNNLFEAREHKPLWVYSLNPLAF